MKKRTISTLSCVLLILLALICVHQILFVLRVPEALARKKGALRFADKYEEYTSIKCNAYDLYFPEYAFINRQLNGEFEELEIMFYKVQTLVPIFHDKDFLYTGGTDITNTTFNQLVKMVAEDCGQFKRGDRKNETSWIHSPAKSLEEITREKIETLEYRFSGYGDETQEAFTKEYGDIEKMTDSQKVELFDRIDEEGLVASVDNYWQVDIFLEDLRYLTQSQRDAIRTQYGEWDGVSHDDILEWATKMKKDIDAGIFNPEEY